MSVSSTALPLPAELAYEGGVELLHPANIRPGLAGFEGRAFSCTFISGALPAGLSLSNDCVISGRATQPGHPHAVVSVTIAGASGTMTWNLSINIATPGADYNVAPLVTFGSSIDLKPEPTQWKPATGDTLTYSVTGMLPPGVVLDPATGRISGTPTQRGTYVFDTSVQVTSGGLTVTIPSISGPNTLLVQ